MKAEDRTRALGMLRRAEGLVAVSDPDAATAALAETRLAWAEFQADVDEIDPELTQQFEAASDAVREAIAERQQERAAEQERANALAREQADRVIICQQIEALAGPDAADRIAELKVQWDGLAPMPSEYAASLNRRFQDACRAFEDQERRRLLAHAAVGRLETLATELEQLVASDQPLEEIIARWRGLRRDADVLREHAAANPAAAERLERAVATLEEKEHQHQQVRAKQEQDNLKRLQQVCRQVETLAAAEQITLKAGDRALRDIRAALEERVPLPSKKDRQDIQARLDAARATLGPRVQELRDADEWQRWANLQVQEELCREMEALKTEENLETSSRRMRELQGRWKQVALAPRAQGEAMWRRFKAAQDEVFARTSAHMAAQNEERHGNLARKQTLSERAEALADSTDWVRTATEIQKLQAEWKTIGPVTRGHEKAVWERFRAACDRFFTRRQEDLKQRKDDWSANLTRKEALCERAEALADSSEWDAAASQLKQLQAEWKTVGPVRKSKSEAVWQRFRTACDRFFDRYKHRDQVDLQGKAAPREAIIRELEALLPAAPDAGADAPAESRGRDSRRAGTLAAGAGAAAADPAGLRGALSPGARPPRRRVAGGVCRHRSRSGEHAEADGEAARARRRARHGAAEGAGATVTDRAARAAVARAARGEHDGRQPQRRGNGRQRVGAPRSRKSATRRRSGRGSVPCPPEVAGPLNERFQRACRRFYDQRRRAS